MTLMLPFLRFISGLNEQLRNRVRVAIVLLDYIANLRGCEHIAQPVAAQQERGFRPERQSFDLDKRRFAGLTKARANIAEHLVAAGMAHGLILGEFPSIPCSPTGE